MDSSYYIEPYLLQGTQGIRPPLQLERKVSPPGICCCCSRADRIQPSQRDLGLALHSTNQQRLSQESFGWGNLCLLRPPLTPSPATLTLARWWMMEWRSSDPSPKLGSDYNALHFAQSPVWAPLVQQRPGRCHSRSNLDKPARLIIRLLFRFASDSETSAATPWERV